MKMKALPEKLQDRLSYPPRGMNCDRACAYVGLSKSKFLELVRGGYLPQPKNLGGGVSRWDRLDLDAAFDSADERTLPGTDIMERKAWDDFVYANKG
jgi:predicted DNA-binding transcriptional regulator AlpA